MTNLKVLESFIKKQEGATNKRIIDGYYEGRTLQSNGQELVNYSTVIARWKDDFIEVNTTHYSQTTTKIQNNLIFLIKNNNIKYIEVEA